MSRFLLALLLSVAPIAAHADDSTACTEAIATAQRALPMPPRVLGSIALVESGRAIGRRVVPWPWSINVDGVGQVFASKVEAVDAVRALNAAGPRSIDVGCMQVNLNAHPQAFASIEEAFDPGANARYAARFIGALYRQTGQIAKAMTAYHSQTPAVAADYARRLLTVWPEAASLGLAAEPEAPSAFTPGFAREIAANRDALRRAGSSRGAAWPASR